MAGLTPAIDSAALNAMTDPAAEHRCRRFSVARVRVIRRGYRAAFTLMEGLIASVVLATTVIGITMAMSASYQTNVHLEEAGASTALARQLLEEIASRPYLDPTTQLIASPGNGSRSSYTSLGQYQGYTDQTSSMTTLGGATVPVIASGTYTRSVVIQWRDDPAGSGLATNNDMAMVTVSVTTPSGRVIQISKLFTAAALTS